MRYALLVYADQSEWNTLSDEEAAAARAESMPAWIEFFGQLGAVDPDSSGKELAAATDAKVVRVRNGDVLVTDGPFPDTKEQIGGIFLTTLPDLDEAIRIAALVPAASYGSLEIRPIAE